jgi:integrase
MSVYFVKKKGWRYDFTLKGSRYTKGWYKRKQDARKAETVRREEIRDPEPAIKSVGTQTDMAFLEILNRRLDHVESYNSESHFQDVKYHCLRWQKQWKGLSCNEITTDGVEVYLKKRLRVSAYVANKELQYLRATFNFGVKKSLIMHNPTDGIEFFPIDKRKKYVPPKEDILKVIAAGDPEAQQYLWTIILTAGRVGEINNLTWDDVDFEKRSVTLWTRKRKGGNRESREVPMIKKLYDILDHRFKHRNPQLPWVFCHTYWSRRVGGWVKGPYADRKKLMSILCTNAKVRYFRYHALRHLTASMLDDLGVAIGTIQRILGHQNRRTTEIYLHSIGEAEREAMSKLENAQTFGSEYSPVEGAPTNTHVGFWSRKVDRPLFDVLRHDVKKLGYTGTGRKYGVSDNAVRKWLKVYEAQEQSKAVAI